MQDDRGPWRRDETPGDQPRASRSRFTAWFVMLVAVAVLVGLLFKAFPGALHTGDDVFWLLRGMLLLAVVSTVLLTARRIRWAEKAQHAAIWAAIVGVLVLGYTYRSELGGVAQRIRGEFSSSYPVAVSPHEIAVARNGGGSFLVMGRVNGERVQFLVDTGSSETVLTPADAERLGVDISALRFDQVAETANGMGYGATFIADSLEVGDIRFTDVPMVINQAPMRNSLLGMSFLQRLASYRVEGDKLYLKSRGE